MRPSKPLAVATLAAAALLTAAPGASASPRCADPADSWQRRAPTDLGLNAAELQKTLDWATGHASLSVAVYRHGCLAAQSRLDAVTGRLPLDGWSMTKSVTSMLVGRAVTLGKLDIDQPIGHLFGEADPGHAALTPRHLLTMTSGLHRNWIRDISPQPDSVRDALSLPFDHAPGTYWEYGQSPVTLVAEAVSRAVGRDIQDFAQAELFGKIGIPRSAWAWDRDGAGHTLGWAHLRMRADGWARLGQLMLHGGRWQGRQLISRSYVRRALRRIPTNHAYGLLFWLNGSDTTEVPAVYARDVASGQLIPAAPRDTFAMVGMGEERVYIIPSCDMVIVRLGDRGSHDLDTRVTVWTGRAGQLDYELVRGVMRSVTDVQYADPGPYRGSSLTLPPIDTGVLHDALDLDDVIAGLVGPRS